MRTQDISAGKNYNSGKKGEKEADQYLRSAGFVRPRGKQKSNLVSAFASRGYNLKVTAFDLVEEWVSNHWNNPKELAKVIDKVVLYEMKSASASREKPLNENWEGLGFTYSCNEDHNWKVLGDDKYKFIFVDCLRKRHILLNKNDWLQNARTTETMSVWINKPLFA